MRDGFTPRSFCLFYDDALRCLASLRTHCHPTAGCVCQDAHALRAPAAAAWDGLGRPDGVAADVVAAGAGWQWSIAPT